MGQCYEFGVAIHATCGHAMRVGAAGGQCECPTCGATCTGRFEGCAGILEQPGYVPVTAPGWAVDLTEPPPPTPTLPSFTRRAGTAAAVIRDAMTEVDLDPLGVVSTDALVRSGQPAMGEIRDELLGATDSLRRELSDRDKELVDAFNNLADSYSQLSVVVESDRETTRVIVEGIARIARRVGRLEKRLVEEG